MLSLHLLNKGSNNWTAENIILCQLVRRRIAEVFLGKTNEVFWTECTVQVRLLASNVGLQRCSERRYDLSRKEEYRQ